MSLRLRSIAMVLSVCASAPSLTLAHDRLAANDPRPRRAMARREPRSRAKTAARTVAPEIESIVSETHPAVNEAYLAASVVRVIGKGFGTAQAEDSVELTLPALPAPLRVEVLSWRDNEIRVRLPIAASLGVDPATAALLGKELIAPKRYVAVGAKLCVMHAGTRIDAPEELRVAVAVRDFDGDGREREKDADDLDPAR